MIFRYLSVVLSAFLTACSGPGYYMQAVSGQWKLMHAREDIQSVLNDPATTPELTEQLLLADQIKTFARNSLDLPANGSYSSYVEVEGDALVWNVVATGEFSLQPKKWCFPVAGCVPYRGFFKQQKAMQSAERYRRKGMDVYVSPAVAYSSLGWFSDPLLSTMLSGSDVRMAAYLFHELAHQRLYIKDDGVFNEGYASFVEETGLKQWLETNQRQDDLQQWKHLQNVSMDFNTLIGETRHELSELYHTDSPETEMRERKNEILDSFLRSLEKLRNEKWQGKQYYQSWFEEPLNNARLALYDTYAGSHCAFQRLWLESDGNPQEFHRLAEERSRLKKEQRHEWLKQSCPTIAPQAKL
ncbi:aminopeptidase [Pseudomonadota bacterium]